ncbi:hypothetical protein [Streptomyces erythrochromogenes]|uniref:hypothetical protein n=1 Tax=Streptomyces erythrochromogenes TaxID=285574 RepID=UPI0036B7059E
MNKLAKIAATAASATALLALAGAPAEAATTAYNTRSVTLTAHPTEAMPKACVTRDIYLATGDYKWSQILGGARVPNRDIYIAAGWYTWSDCITPRNGHYKQQSWLSKPGSATATLADTNELYLSGTYTFGSELAPKF